MPVDAARRELSKNPDLAAVIVAAESGDAAGLLALAKKTQFLCTGYRGAPAECERPGEFITGVYQDCGNRCVRSLVLMEEWISLTLSYGPVELEFAARDSRLPEGDGGLYFLTFRASKPGWDEYDGIALVVQPGTPEPIDEFTFGAGPAGGLSFAQHKAQAMASDNSVNDSAAHVLLVTPETVAAWRDADGATGSITVVRPESVQPAVSPTGVHPMNTMTGVAAIDAFLEKAYAGNLSSLAKGAVFSPVRCLDSVDFPRCDAGDLPNTPYDVVGVYNCDKHFARSVEELEGALEEIDGEGRQFLLFVLAPERAPGPYREAAGEYIVGLRTASYPRRTFYLDAQGRLLTVDSCPGSYPNFSYGHVPAEAIIVGPP